MELQIHQFLPPVQKLDLGAIYVPQGAHFLKFRCKNRHMATLFTLLIDDEPIARIAVNETSHLGNEETQYGYVPEISEGMHKISVVADHDFVFMATMSFTAENPMDSAKEPSYPPIRNTNTDLMTATDMLGRKMPDADEVGPLKAKKEVALFYWTWRDNFAHLKPRNLTEILKKYPEAEFNINHPIWTSADHVHWSEPMYGFYRNMDRYVIRKHAIMLADAGVDVVMMDCTNGSFLWMDSLTAILEGFQEAKADGINVPKFALIMNFGPIPHSVHSIRAAYQHIYKPGRFKDLWYMWEGKPLLLAYPQAINDVGISDFDTQQIKETKEFFTFRYPQPGYDCGIHPDYPLQWGWLENAPQHEYVKREDGTCEMMTVGVAQNRNFERNCTFFNDKDTFGRSFTFKDKHAKLTEDSYLYGYNFQEQWDNVLASKPDLVFITGWNEWTMGKSRDSHWIRDPKSTQIGFVDQYDREHSRDIEPDKDGYLDTYYLQMVSNIRRFKGLEKCAEPVQSKTITSLNDWKEIQREYIAHKGSAPHRACKGMGDYYYENKTGRNNIIAAKVTYDTDYVYFYAETAKPFVGVGSNNFMTLLIDTDRNTKTGWMGYDIFVKNGVLLQNGQEIALHQEIGENTLYVAIPRVYIPSLNFEFKWTDNVPETDIMKYYQDGDTAPNGRFNFVFKAE